MEELTEEDFTEEDFDDDYDDDEEELSAEELREEFYNWVIEIRRQRLAIREKARHSG